MKKRDFLALSDFSLAEWARVFARAAALKAGRGVPRQAQAARQLLAGKTVALVFEKASTRTRVSFEVGLRELGADVVVIHAGDSQLGRGEPIEDTARVLSRYVHGVMLRTHGDERLRSFAAAASVPVINGLSDLAHPVQVAADLFTLLERRGSYQPSALRGVQAAFVGDGACNMSLSWMEAARLFSFQLRVGSPPGYQPSAEAQASAGGNVTVTADARAAVQGAEVVNTDVWISMGMEDEALARRQAFVDYCVDEALMQHAKAEAVVLHCLPAHRGEEISAAVLEGPQSAVWDQAENRLHIQKAILVELMTEAHSGASEGEDS